MYLGLIRHTSRDLALVIKPFLASVVQIPFRIHQELYAAIAENAGAERRRIVAAAGSNIILRGDQ